MGPSYQERPLPPRPLSIHQNSTTGPEKGDTAYPNSRNAIEFRLLFNIDANTTMNVGKYDTWFYLIKSYSILGFCVYLSAYIQRRIMKTSEIVPILN